MTRAEVPADLEVWRQSGMAAFTFGEAEPDTSGHAYQVALARYGQLRAAPEFAQRVIRIARERGESVDIASR